MPSFLPRNVPMRRNLSLTDILLPDNNRTRCECWPGDTTTEHGRKMAFQSMMAEALEG